MKKKKELQEKISEAVRYRKMAIIGLIIGIVSSVVGMVLSHPPLFIVGYTVFIICTGITSFLTVQKWQYAKALKKGVEEEKKPLPSNLCPRCGAEVGKDEKYCPKCGKKIQVKRR